MIRRIPTTCAAVGAALLLGLAILPAHGSDEKADRAADRDAVRARTRGFLKALAEGDAKEVAAFWTATGEYAHGEMTIRGRANIEKAYAEHFRTKQPGIVAVEGDSVRFLSEDTAVEEGVFVVKRPNAAGSTRSEFSAILVRSDGKWNFGQLRESPAAPSLEDLAWLVGSWTFPSEGAEARMVVEWTDGKKFLLCRITRKQGEETTTATQILAVHPAKGVIQSWTFESDGSLGEAVWSHGDKGWTAKVKSYTGDGEKATATTILTPVDENSFTFQSVDRTVDGEKAADVGPIKVTRNGAAKGRTIQDPGEAKP
jgi:uncharacterized protein (TIGR02246 family)